GARGCLYPADSFQRFGASNLFSFQSKNQIVRLIPELGGVTSDDKAAANQHQSDRVCPPSDRPVSGALEPEAVVATQHGASRLPRPWQIAQMSVVPHII